MGCTSASRRGGPAWGSGGVTTRPGLRHSRRLQLPPGVRSGSLRGARTGSVHRAAITLPLPIGCTFISNRGTTEGASPNSPSPRAGSTPSRSVLAIPALPSGQEGGPCEPPFVFSGVTSGCCRRCSDLGRHQCRSLSRWDPVPLSSSRMCRSMSLRKNRVQDRRLRPRLHSRTRDPRRRSVKELVCVPCSPPSGMTRAACYWEALNRPGLGAPVSWLQDGSPKRLIARDCGEIGAGGLSCPREPVLLIQASLLGIAGRPCVGLRSPQER